MTDQQKIEFAKLQLTYMAEVQRQDTHRQAELIELIFFWIEKQIVLKVLNDASSVGMTSPPVLPKLTDGQKLEFARLQEPFIMSFYDQDRQLADVIEKAMHGWIDKQCEEAGSKVMTEHVKPKFKIIK